MRFAPVEGFPTFQRAIGLSFLEVEAGCVRVSISDDWLTFVHLTFETYQGLRLTTEDCFCWPGDFDHLLTVVRVEDSPWLHELQEGLRVNDPGANFMHRAHHFLIPSRDSIVEVVAWEMTWEVVPAHPAT